MRKSSRLLRTAQLIAAVVFTMALAGFGAVSVREPGLERLVFGRFGLGLALAGSICLAVVAISSQRHGEEEYRPVLIALSIVAIEVVLLVVAVRFFYIK